jgi:hypothetical protein
MKIIQCNDCNPELIQPQYASFKKHLQDDFQMVICNSLEMARDPRKCQEVLDVCHLLGIETVQAKRDKSIELYRNTNFTYGSPEPFFSPEGRFWTPGNAGNYLMQWSWEKIVCKLNGPICYTHSDVFLIEPIRFTDYLKDYQICSILPNKPAQKGHGFMQYLWEPLLLVDMDRLPSPETMIWWPSEVENEWTDTGGRTYYYLRDHPELKVLELGQSSSIIGDAPNDDDFKDPTVDFHPTRYRFIHFPDKRAFHYMSGTRWCTDSEHGWNWPKEKADEYHRRKMAWTRKLAGIE